MTEQQAYGLKYFHRMPIGIVGGKVWTRKNCPRTK